MPAIRLLALAPAPGQQLQLMRNAGSASSSSTTRNTTATRQGSYGKDRRTHSNASSSRQSSRVMSTATAPSPQLSWCRGASPAVALFYAQTTAANTNSNPRRARIHSQQQALSGSTRPFSTATMPKQVAFPRHGKAVAPVSPEKEKITPPAGESKTSTQTPEGQDATSAASTPALEKQPAKKNGKRAEAGTEAKTKEDAAADTATATATEKPVSTEPPAAKVDALGALGRTDGSSPDLKPTDPASIAADTAAAAVTAAETASVAADIIDGAGPVIELGPPKVTIDAILTQNEGEQAQQRQSDQQQQTESESSSLSARQPLSHNKLPPPHLAPPLYVHHFDSYSLVKQLEEGGYRKEQAVTAMKAVRSLLAQNLDVAQSSLVSKSDVENESYLFKAACAELSIEVRNNRRRADELVRQQRTLLQHEVDIASQSVNQELVTLADVVKELFNDRKMAVREEQKTLESAIQQLSYKITIMLNSEMRSEIEALRWVLIRRSVLGIIFMAILTLGTLRYASYISHEKQRATEQALREAREAEAQRFADTKIDTSAPPDAAEILAAN
ncbi:hypothetical protein SEUCBS140593_004139 [Sporothrix eucalyptigena]|uniref:MOZ protein represents a chromatin-associated acetyltransferase n=1 Tax=Sporothrix eucalyptigena TaxID=1812306 RepID=A0ABP0BKP9_9PEZI